MPLKDDPRLLDGPIGFAVRINQEEAADVDAARKRIPGLMQFARTFIAELLEREFELRPTGFPNPTRERVAALTARHRAEGKQSSPAQRLLVVIIDICDFDIDREETSGEEDAEEEEKALDKTLDLIGRLLEKFDEWIDSERLPELGKETRRGVSEFAAASAKLT